jgi:hypothetical protein
MEEAIAIGNEGDSQRNRSALNGISLAGIDSPLSE